MLKLPAFWSFIFFLSNVYFGQAQAVLIKGTVKDLESSESITGVAIRDKQNPDNAAYSGLNGNFQISVAQVPCVLLIKKNWVSNY